MSVQKILPLVFDQRISIESDPIGFTNGMKVGRHPQKHMLIINNKENVIATTDYTNLVLAHGAIQVSPNQVSLLNQQPLTRHNSNASRLICSTLTRHSLPRI